MSASDPIIERALDLARRVTDPSNRWEYGAQPLAEALLAVDAENERLTDALSDLIYAIEQESRDPNVGMGGYLFARLADAHAALGEA